ncbi:hypothetical protein ACB098_02G147400 [Castanea mollissima]
MSLPTTSIQYLEIAYLDTDVGQPKFTPPGFLSLTVVDKLSPDLTIPCLNSKDTREVLLLQ